MIGRLSGKSILLVGAGGIGDGLAHRYADEGASVLIGDIDGAAAKRVAEEITGRGGAAVGIELDAAQESAIVEAVAQMRSLFGGIDGLHANFTYLCQSDHVSDVITLPLDDFDTTLRTNARGYMLCTRHVLPAMLERGGGSIVYTGSDSAYLGAPIRLAYSMSKSAVHALMRHVANRFGEHGIRANVISPGIIMHSKVELFSDEDIARGMAQNLIKTRLGKPDDIAAMAALLMADEGAYVTGQVINVNGGITVRP